MKRNKEIKNDAIECLIVAPGAFSSGIMGGMSSAFSDPAAIMTMMGTNMLLSSISSLGSIFGINPLTVGLSNSLKLFVKDSDMQTIPNMFKLGFGEGRYWRNVLGMFLMGLFTFLWTLLFIIPGIIKSYAYAMTPYILVDYPELSPNEARLKSIEMMRGHKWKFFGLQLSFIGWFLLCILSLGIGFLLPQSERGV